MNKIITAVVSAGLLLGSAACGNDGGSDTGENSTPEYRDGYRFGVSLGKNMRTASEADERCRNEAAAYVESTQARNDRREGCMDGYHSIMGD